MYWIKNSLKQYGVYALLGVLFLLHAVRCAISRKEQHKIEQLRKKKIKILIVGASDGIGREVAIKYGRMLPCSDIILASRNTEKLEKIKEVIESQKHSKEGSVQIISCDVTKDKDLDKLFTFVKDTFGGCLDRLIWNAGGISCLTVEQLAAHPSHDKIVDDIMKLNLLAPIKFTIRVLDLLKNSEAKDKSIVVVSSLAGRVAAPRRSIYCATKFGLNGFFDSLRCEVSKFGINLTIVCPGSVNTDLRHNSMENAVDDKEGRVKGLVVTNSNSNSMSTAECANGIFYAAENNLRELWLPRHAQFIVPLVQYFYPSYIDQMARKKYEYY